MSMPLLTAICAILLVPSAAPAQGIGFQGGATVNPNQLYVGTHYELPLGSDQIVLRPIIDGAFGSGLRAATIGADFQYRFDLGNSGWRLAQGFGPGVHIAAFRITRIAAPGDGQQFPLPFEPVEDVREVRGVWTYGIGVVHERGFFVEFKGGGSRGGVIPILRLGAGFTIRPERP